MIYFIIYFVCGFTTASLNFMWKQLDEEYLYFKEDHQFNFVVSFLFPFLIWIFFLIDRWMFFLDKIVNVIKNKRENKRSKIF